MIVSLNHLDHLDHLDCHNLDHLDHLNQVSIAVAKELYGNVEFSGNLFVGDQGDNDWVS